MLLRSCGAADTAPLETLMLMLQWSADLCEALDAAELEKLRGGCPYLSGVR